HEAHFKFSQISIDKMILEKKIRLLCKDCGYQHYEGQWISCPNCKGDNVVPQYLVKATDKKILDTNWMDISGYSSRWGFSTENSEALLERAIKVGSDSNDYVMDYFAGSGTAIAVAEKMGRKWIGIEMGNQIWDVILPRLKDVLHGDSSGISKSYDWGGSGFFKYHTLESYEDALNNLTLKRTQEQQLALEASSEFKENYLLSYMLDVESKDSLLNIDSFVHPFNYQLNIASGTVGESKPTKVDLVETFNYLIGLHVETMQVIRGFHVVTGKNPAGERTLIIWRDLEEKSNTDLEEFFRKQAYNSRDMEYDLIYVNGDNNLENIRRPDETWKVRLIEEEFLKLMFDTEE
ncbi:MAG: site-specific DNA-methyltransferase, partial [Bacillota bacterium]